MPGIETFMLIHCINHTIPMMNDQTSLLWTDGKRTCKAL